MSEGRKYHRESSDRTRVRDFQNSEARVAPHPAPSNASCSHSWTQVHVFYFCLIQIDSNLSLSSDFSFIRFLFHPIPLPVLSPLASVHKLGMKLKALESLLQQVETFAHPKIQLEQYQTSAHLGARILHVASSRFGSICGRSVLDLGCGCGTFTIGSLLMGAEYVLGIDIDSDALDSCKKNLADILDEDASKYDLIQADVTHSPLFQRLNNSFDTVITNPPFGTKNNKGMDVTFLRTALDIATDCVYSLHKTSTRKVSRW